MRSIKVKFYSLLILIAVVLVGAVLLVDQMVIDNHRNEIRQEVHDSLMDVKARLTFNLYKNIQVVKGLPALFSAYPSLPKEKFGLAVQDLLDEHSQLRNIAAAPNLVIKYMYPIEGNEAAIGVDYRTLPLQLDAVMQAKESREVVLAGPLKLVQGGDGLISRSPVFVHDAEGNESFWGIISAVIDVNLLYKKSGLFDPNSLIEIAIRGRNGLGVDGEVFFGDATMFDGDNIYESIQLPSGSWQIAAKHIDGWGVLQVDIRQKRFFIFALALLVFSAVFVFLRMSLSSAIANQKFKNLLEESPVPYALKTDKNITFLNNAFISTYGYTLNDIPTLDSWCEKAYPDPVYNKKLRGEWAAYIEHFHSSDEKTSALEVTIRCKDGSNSTALISFAENKQTSTDEFPVILYDITERKQAEQVAKEREEQIASFYKLGLVGLVITSPEKGWVRINQRLCEMLEYSEDELRAMTWAELTHPDDLNVDVEQFAKLLDGDIESYNMEKHFISQSGKTIPTNLVVGCVRKPDGAVDYVTAMIQDISAQKQNEAELIEAEERLQLSQSAGGIGTWEVDFINDKGVWSDAVTQQLGFPDLAEPTWGDYLDTIHPEDRERVVSKVNLHIEEGVLLDVDYRIIDTSGKIRWMHSVGKAEFDANGVPIKMRGTLQDITVRHLAEEKMRLSNRVFNETSEGILITDWQKNIIDINPGFTAITGYSTEDVKGQNPIVLSSGKQSPQFYEDMWQSIDENGHWRGEMWNRKKNGDVYAESLSISIITDDEGDVLNYVGIFTDVTDGKKQQEILNLMAHYDVLTKLPNRALFTDRFNQAIAHSKRTQHQLAICFLDLDNFKPINDNFGHDVGDEVLLEVANRISANLREEDTVSRQGGDEFALLLNDVESVSQSKDTLKRIHEALAEPILVDDVLHHLTASSGVTFYPSDNGDIDTLLRHADQAMYQAKLSGKNRYHVFNAEEDQRTIKKHHQLGEVAQALIKHQFTLYYQPKVNMRTGEVYGMEALIRWLHPEKGLISPLSFLPVIEGSELEIEVGDWVISQALEQISLWIQKGLRLEVSVNISSKHLLSGDFVNKLAVALAQHEDLDAQLLQLEILESSALGNLKTISEVIQTCRSRFGVNVALDDFGTGYSSLTHLRNLPVDTVKIDQSFVRDMLDDPNDYAIIDGVIGLADTFNRAVVAEGVETVEHGVLLLLMGCELAQGFGIARPMPAADVTQWLADHVPNEKWLLYADKQYSIKENRKEFLQIAIEQWQHKFVSKLEASFDGKTSWPILDAGQCHCGTWLKREKQERLFAAENVSQIDQLHSDCHKMADTLVQKFNSGEVEQAQEGVSKLQSLFIKLKGSLEKVE